MTKMAFGRALLAMALIFTGTASFALPLSLVVDPNRSTLSIDVTSGFAVAGSEHEQAPGSWTTSYTGNIIADVTNSSVQILTTTKLVAGISGVWGPAPIYPTTDPPKTRAEEDLEYVNSSSPANYGTVMDFSNRPPINGVNPPSASNSAIRDLQLSLIDSAAKTLSPSGAFSEAGTQPGFLSGIVWLTYGNASYAGPLTNLAGEGIAVTTTADVAGEGNLTRVGDYLTMTLPVEFTEVHFGSTTVYSGTIVAGGWIPEPTTMAMLVPAASMLGLGARRRK